MDSQKTNIEKIQKQIQEETFIKETTLYDGISFECTIPEGKTFKQCKTELNKKCKELKLLPISTEQNKDNEKLFILQFPELVPYYTEEQIYLMRYRNLDYQIDTSIKSSAQIGVKVTKQMLIDSIGIFVNECIRTFYNWNMNKYKVTLEELLKDLQLRQDTEKVFYEVLTKYYK